MKKYFENYAEIEAIVLRAKNGDKAASETLIMSFKPLIISEMDKVHCSPNEYDDALQEGRIVILTAIKNYDVNTKKGFGSYLHDQMHFYFMQRRAGRHGLPLEFALSFEKLQNNGFDPVDEKEPSILGHEDLRLFQAMKMLNANQRKALVDYYFNGKSQRQIAEAEGVSRLAITMRIARGIENLRDYLK